MLRDRISINLPTGNRKDGKLWRIWQTGKTVSTVRSDKKSPFFCTHSIILPPGPLGLGVFLHSPPACFIFTEIAAESMLRFRAVPRKKGLLAQSLPFYCSPVFFRTPQKKRGNPFWADSDKDKSVLSGSFPPILHKKSR